MSLSLIFMTPQTHKTDTRNISLFSPCPVMPPRKAGVPKQQQRGPSISTTAPTKHISSSSKPGKSEISSNISNTSNKENNNKVAASTTSH